MKRQMAAFIATSGAAALANFASRAAFSVFLPFAVAIVAAFCIGLGTAFLLNRRYVFTDGTDTAARQFVRFTAVNLIGLAQTLGISLLLADYVLPSIGWHWHAAEIAHAVGIAVPIATSFLGHKYFSFRRGTVTHD
jgi:putative flippase GtrA